MSAVNSAQALLRSVDRPGGSRACAATRSPMYAVLLRDRRRSRVAALGWKRG